MNLKENSCRNHESLRQKRQESWISRFKWFRFKPRLFEISDCWPVSVFKTFSDLIQAIQKQRLLNMHKEFNEMKCIQKYVQSVSNKSTYRSTEYRLLRQGDCVAPLRLKDTNAGQWQTAPRAPSALSTMRKEETTGSGNESWCSWGS